MKQIIFCFSIFTMILFSCDAMDKKKVEDQKKPINSPRRPSPLASPRSINLPISAVVFEFNKEEDGIYHITVGEQNFKEICDSKKKRNGQKNNQEPSKILVLDQHELGPLVEYIKKQEGFGATIKAKNQEIYSLQRKVISLLKGKQEPEEEVVDLEAKIETQKKIMSFLDNSSTTGMHDTRTFAEKNVVPIGILCLCAGIVVTSGICLWQTK